MMDNDGAAEPAEEYRAGIPVSSPEVLRVLGVSAFADDTAEPVTVETALGVPSVWAAVNFLAGTLAGLPLDVHRRGRNGSIQVTSGIAVILGEAPNEETTSFNWRKYFFEQVFTYGRGAAFIERAPSGRVINIWPLNVESLTLRRREGRTLYDYRDGMRTVTYEASEVIDLPFMLKANQLNVRSPIVQNRMTIGLALAMTRHGTQFFGNGGVPPLVLTGPMTSGAALKRASDDMTRAIQEATREKRKAIALPVGHELKPIGVDLKNSQLESLKRLLNEDIARIYSLPPTFLQDLTHGTHSNTEQQDLHFVKHTLRRWVKQFEQELNLKLFRRGGGRQYVKLNVDGILRGDFQARMTGLATAIQNGVRTPNEARELENLPAMANGDDLLIQGATVPLGSQSGVQGDADEGAGGAPPATLTTVTKTGDDDAN